MELPYDNVNQFMTTKVIDVTVVKVFASSLTVEVNGKEYMVKQRFVYGTLGLLNPGDKVTVAFDYLEDVPWS